MPAIATDVAVAWSCCLSTCPVELNFGMDIYIATDYFVLDLDWWFELDP